MRITDVDPSRAAAVHRELRFKLDQLNAAGLLHERADTIAGRVQVTSDLKTALAGVDLVQECAPEQLDLKRDLFATLVELAPEDCVLASSSSALTATQIAAGSAQVMVAHPGNPPHLIPVIELVPSPSTSSQAVEKAQQIYRDAGLTPVLVKSEIEGFIFNRLQGAVLREAYALVRDGVGSVDDIDAVMRDGLGRRWAFMGPFETVDLNTRGGIESHATKMGPAYLRMGKERGQEDPWTPDLVADVASQRRDSLPLEEWDARVAWRDQQLIDGLVARQEQDRRNRDSR